MNITLNVSKSIFNDVYLPYLNDDTFLQIFYGGSSSGKSIFAAQRTVLDVAKGGHNYLCIRKVAKTIRGSNFNEIKKAIKRLKLDGAFDVRESDLIITCKNGYQILFAGLDDPEKIKSITAAKGVITDIDVEEATECEREDIKQLEKRLRGLSKVKKRLILRFNPIFQTHWIYQEYFGEWDSSRTVYQDANKLILKTTYKDNKFLTADDVYRLENEKDEYYRQVYTYGNWGVLGSAIFKNWRVEDLSEQKKEFDNYYNGLDFGFAADPAALIRAHFDRKNKKIYITDELFLFEATNNVLARELSHIIGKDTVVCDSVEPKSIRELCEYGINAISATKGKDSINHGIQWLQQFELILDVNCINLRTEMQIYKWQEDGNGNTIPKPVDRNNHGIDALRYAFCREWHVETERQEVQKSYIERRYERLGIKYKQKIGNKAGSL